MPHRFIPTYALYKETQARMMRPFGPSCPCFTHTPFDSISRSIHPVRHKSTDSLKTLHRTELCLIWSLLLLSLSFFFSQACGLVWCFAGRGCSIIKCAVPRMDLQLGVPKFQFPTTFNRTSGLASRFMNLLGKQNVPFSLPNPTSKWEWLFPLK